jgi:hypothetical protein
MSIETNTSSSPYFDDFDDSKNYARILFKPGTAVQVRELNQIQTLIQDQIEKFGDHIYQRGTIISGCQPTFLTSLPYAKLTDRTSNQSALNMPSYKNYFVENSSGVKAKIVHTLGGYESTDPDLNTIYLQYTESSNDGSSEIFQSGQSLNIYSNNRQIEQININTGGASSGFANNDSLLILSALVLANSEGGTTFASAVSVGDILTQTTTGATAEVISVNTTIIEGKLVVGIKPDVNQVIIGNTSSWSFTSDQSDDYLITSDTGSITNANPAYLSDFVGSGATGFIRTNATGQISEITLSNSGTDYKVSPHVTVYSTRAAGPNTTQVNNLSLTAQNYKAGVTISSLANSVGTSYAMEVSGGVIYQKGFFINSESQFALVEKYSNYPDGLQVGFVTQETIANSSIDTTLNDNAAGFSNFAAPGANRLKLRPILTTKTDAAAAEDQNFLGIWKFRTGRLAVTQETTQYSAIGDEMAKRTYQESGNFYVSGFEGTTASTEDISSSDTHFLYKFTGGEAYIQGYRVTVPGSITARASKSTETKTETNNTLQFNYGSYVDVIEVAGDFNFTEGGQISLGSSSAEVITDHTGDIGSAVSGVAEIGKARIRTLVHDRTKGPQGQANTRYKAYLFDIKMNQGKSFFDVKSLYEGNNAVADVLLQVTEGSGGQRGLGALLKKSREVSQIVNTGQPLKTVSNTSYEFKKKNTTSVNTSGQISITNATNATFPYGTVTLTSQQEDEIIVIPEEDIVSTTALTGTVTGSSTTLTGSATAFFSELQAGDYFTAGASTYRVVSVNSDTSLTYSPAATIAGGTSIYRTFVQNIPVPMGARDNINASATSTSLTINLPVTLGATKSITVISKQRDSSSVTKGITRNAFVKVQANTHFKSTTGPWSLGHSDIVRLIKVYAGDSETDADITDNFVINQNHNDQYYGLSELQLKKDSTYTIGADDVLLVKFDVLTTSTAVGAGVKTISSYTIDDEKRLEDLTSANVAINTLEIPEFRSGSDYYYDLRECLDFRPKSANTVAVVTVANTAPTNPKIYGPTANTTHAIETDRFSTELRYPVVGSYVSYDKEYYLSRKDNIILNSSGEVKSFEGGIKNADSSEFLMYSSVVAPYPSYPDELSIGMLFIDDTRTLKDFRPNLKRINRYRTTMKGSISLTQRYSMKDIFNLEKRIQLLEKQISLNSKEKTIQKLSIPSSIDPSIERFKFGYFTDDFSTTNLTETSSSEHTAVVYGGKLRPKLKRLNIPLKLADTSTTSIFGNRIQFPYKNVLLVKQENVTDKPVFVAPPPPAPVPITRKCRWIFDRGEYLGINK